MKKSTVLIIGLLFCIFSAGGVFAQVPAPATETVMDYFARMFLGPYFKLGDPVLTATVARQYAEVMTNGTAWFLSSMDQLPQGLTGREDVVSSIRVKDINGVLKRLNFGTSLKDGFMSSKEVSPKEFGGRLEGSVKNLIQLMQSSAFPERSVRLYATVVTSVAGLPFAFIRKLDSSDRRWGEDVLTLLDATFDTLLRILVAGGDSLNRETGTCLANDYSLNTSTVGIFDGIFELMHVAVMRLGDVSNSDPARLEGLLGKIQDTAKLLNIEDLVGSIDPRRVAMSSPVAVLPDIYSAFGKRGMTITRRSDSSFTISDRDGMSPPIEVVIYGKREQVAFIIRATQNYSIHRPDAKAPPKSRNSSGVGQLVLSRRKSESVIIYDLNHPGESIDLAVVSIGDKSAQIRVTASGRYYVLRDDASFNGRDGGIFSSSSLAF